MATRRHFNPMKGLAWSPPMPLILCLTNDRRIMGWRVNIRLINILSYITTAAVPSTSAGLVASWML